MFLKDTIFFLVTINLFTNIEIHTKSANIFHKLIVMDKWNKTFADVRGITKLRFSTFTYGNHTTSWKPLL